MTDIAASFSWSHGVWSFPGLFLSLLSLLLLVLLPSLKTATHGEQKTLLVAAAEDDEEPAAYAMRYPAAVFSTLAYIVVGNILIPTAFIDGTSTFMTVIIVIVIVALKALLIASVVALLSSFLRRSPIFGARELTCLAWLFAVLGLISIVAHL